MSFTSKIMSNLLKYLEQEGNPGSENRRDVIKLRPVYDKEDSREELEIEKIDTTIGCWSLFRYLGKPYVSGLPGVEKDNRIYFTVPAGTEGLKFWFFTFPLDGRSNEIIEYFVRGNNG